MTDKRWEFELDGAKRSVELEHNPCSNKLSVRVDGKLQTLSSETRQSKARGIKHAFRINGHACEIVIKTYKRGIEYNFFVDAVSDIPETYANEIIEVQNNKQEYDNRRVMIGVVCSF